MWALVKNGTVDRTYGRPIPTAINNVNYPKEVFTLYSIAEQKAIGIYEVIPKSRPNINLYDIGSYSYSYDGGTDAVSEDFTTTEKDLSTLKTSHTHQTQLRANDDLRRFSWVIERYICDNTKTIPSSVKTYMADVRTHCSTITDAIDGCSTFAEFETVYTNIYDSGGTYYTWPSESASVASYVRRDFK